MRGCNSPVVWENPYRSSSDVWSSAAQLTAFEPFRKIALSYARGRPSAKWFQFLFAHSRPTFVSPSNRTMSESPSATAAKIERPSDDQDTRRAMKVARSPKSVI